MLSQNSNSKMNSQRLKAIRDVLRDIADELDAEIHSDTSVYTTKVNYEDVLEYYQSQASAEEGL